jgi:hypothetical protein
VTKFVGEMLKSGDKISFDPKTTQGRGRLAHCRTCAGGMQEHIPGFHSEAETEEWLAGIGRQMWLRARGYAV